MAANGTLAPTVVPMVNGGQASIAISNTSPNLFTVPGDRIIAVNSLDGALTNNEQTASGGVVVATVNKKPFTFILETERGLNRAVAFPFRPFPVKARGVPFSWSVTCAEPEKKPVRGKRPRLTNPCL
ncbi:hypothetical protein EIMP300_00520 [Escherichia coli]|uniref:TraK N-terminal domain-containing protein n=1 Tax=Escherichia coli TaxID=562 RepID=A0A8S0FC62_ECOLX|nr:hypothetical protein EIMP300_00520 [Escherichia coli]